MEMKTKLCVLVALGLLLSAGCPARATKQGPVIPAADRPELWLHLLEGKRVALVSNQTAVLSDGSHLVDLLVKSGVRVVKIFAPEHGFRDLADDGAVINSAVDKRTGLPVVSLYGGATRKPQPAALTDVDLLLFDIQDVGCRFYTYINTLQHTMEAGAANRIPVVVFDRPNPNGFYIDGPVLEPALRSGIGLQPVPCVYGMTIGEYAMMLNGEGWLEGGVRCNLTVIPLAGWNHTTRYSLPVLPSPNLPNDRAVNLYPSLCLFEGTTLSEGRGTTSPFQLFGGPGIDSSKTYFWFVPNPAFGSMKSKNFGVKCWGLDLRNAPEQSQLNLDWILWAYANSTDKSNFFLNDTPGRGSRDFAIRAGTHTLQRQIESGLTSAQIKSTWQPGIAKFKLTRRKYLLYSDFE
jgi:uncharacterized protein YbbC (DUF1343 family)